MRFLSVSTSHLVSNAHPTLIPSYRYADGKVVADLIVARLSIEVEEEAEDSAVMMEEGGDREDEEAALTDETDPEVMDADEEGVNV